MVEEAGSARREPPTTGKQLVNFITCSCESSAPLIVIYKAGREPTLYGVNLRRMAWTHPILVIGLYELLGNPTT